MALNGAGPWLAAARAQAGSAALLAQARGALDDIRKFWGANEPEVAVEGVSNMPTGGMSRQEVLAAYEERFDALRQRIHESSEN